jgi:hypothetical protein
LSATNPSDIFIFILLANFFSKLAGLISVAIYQKINLFDKVILVYLGGLTAFIGFFRASGVLDWLVTGFTWLFQQFGINADFTHALMKPCVEAAPTE